MQEISQLNAQITSLNKENKGLKSDIAKVSKTKTDSKKEIDEVIAEKNELQDKADKLEEQLKELKDQQRETTVNLKAASGEKSKTASVLKDAQSELASLKVQLSEQVEKAKMQSSGIADCEKTIADLNGSLKAKEQEMQSNIQQIVSSLQAESKKKIAGSAQIIETKEAEIKGLQQHIADLECQLATRKTEPIAEFRSPVSKPRQASLIISVYIKKHTNSNFRSRRTQRTKLKIPRSSPSQHQLRRHLRLSRTVIQLHPTSRIAKASLRKSARYLRNLKMLVAHIIHVTAARGPGWLQHTQGKIVGVRL